MLLAIGVTLAKWAEFDVSPLGPSALIRHGQWWRLITDVLPHGNLRRVFGGSDILHLGFNIYWLWVFGAVIEEAFGHLKTAGLLVLFAVGSSALEFGVLDGGIGLSGVGYGFFGLLWMLSKYDRRFQDAIDAHTIQVFVFWFFLCIVTTALHVMSVANLAHAGGLILGVLVGSAIARPQQRKLNASATAVAFALMVWGATSGRPLVNLSGNGGFEEAHLGVQALNGNRNREAVRWLQDATRYRPKMVQFWELLSVAEERAGNHAAALAAFEKAQQLRPAPAASSSEKSDDDSK